MIRDSVASYFRRLANADRLRGDNGMPSETVRVKQDATPFGLRYFAVMKRAGFGTPKAIADALNAKTDSEWTPRQVGYFRTAKYDSIDDAKETTALLKASADLAGRPIDAFFSDEPTPADDFSLDSELLNMVKRALGGPKREFLADAIDLAFSAAISSTNRRHA